MASTRLDHLVVTAPTLALGRDRIESALGVRLEEGGAHARMGTHNVLLRLGGSLYLEVIAVDPAATPPSRPRWFELDRAAERVHLAGWVARTGALDAALEAASEPLGLAEAMSRGDLWWRIAIPADGRWPLGGVGPALIEWPAGVHPATRLPDSGCALVALELRHPEPARVERLLTSLAFVEPDVPVTVMAAAEPRVVAHLRTPLGMRTL